MARLVVLLHEQLYQQGVENLGLQMARDVVVLLCARWIPLEDVLNRSIRGAHKERIVQAFRYEDNPWGPDSNVCRDTEDDACKLWSLLGHAKNACVTGGRSWLRRRNRRGGGKRRRLPASTGREMEITQSDEQDSGSSSTERGSTYSSFSTDVVRQWATQHREVMTQAIAKETIARATAKAEPRIKPTAVWTRMATTRIPDWEARDICPPPIAGERWQAGVGDRLLQSLLGSGSSEQPAPSELGDDKLPQQTPPAPHDVVPIQEHVRPPAPRERPGRVRRCLEYPVTWQRPIYGIVREYRRTRIHILVLPDDWHLLRGLDSDLSLQECRDYQLARQARTGVPDTDVSHLTKGLRLFVRPDEYERLHPRHLEGLEGCKEKHVVVSQHYLTHALSSMNEYVWSMADVQWSEESCSDDYEDVTVPPSPTTLPPAPPAATVVHSDRSSSSAATTDRPALQEQAGALLATQFPTSLTNIPVTWLRRGWIVCLRLLCGRRTSRT